MQTYGLSEVGILRSKSKSSSSLWVKVGGEGFETRVVDDMLEIKAKSAMLGYLNAPSPFTEDGWFKTGDTAKLRSDGRLVFLGRYKDMLKVGGENVSPAEVESHLMKLEDIHSVSVVGYPDDRLHEVGVAFVIRKSNSALLESDVTSHLRGKVASFKIPKHVIFVDEFPMTSSGKVQKVKLRSLARSILD